MKAFAYLILVLQCAQVAWATDDEFFLKKSGDPIVLKAFEGASLNRHVFLSALDERGAENSKYEYYAAYLKFEEGEKVEYLWLADVQKYKDFYIGVILSEPRLLSNTKAGTTIGFQASDIYDWQLSDKQTGEVLGAYLICATSDEQYLKENSFSCSL